MKGLKIYQRTSGLKIILFAGKLLTFLTFFQPLNFEKLVASREQIDDVLTMLDEAPQTKDDEGARELASKQHSMWITEPLDNG
jgi:hypothetical protein